MSFRSREVHLARRPDGEPVPEDFALVDVELPEPGDGEVLVRNRFMSVDPYMRGRMDDVRSYAASYRLGEVMYGGAVGEVVSSRSDRLAPGDHVLSNAGWREAFVAPAGSLRPVAATGVPLSAWLGALGMPGLTAYVGLVDIGRPLPGQTVLVSAATGAVGGVVGQLARLRGCRAVGVAGGPAKVAFCTGELGFAAAVDYKAGDLDAQLATACPDGVDVYFDNVGGAVLQAALTAMNDFGRIPVCGMISQYNRRTPGPDNLTAVVRKRLLLQGFIISDHADRTAAFEAEVAPLLADGRLVAPETVVSGIDAAPEAFLRLLRGEHLGKLVVGLG